jgi:multidrug resistance efflux pump
MLKCAVAILFVSLAPAGLVSIGNAQSPSEVEVEVRDCIVRFAQEVRVPALGTGRIGQMHAKPNDAIKQNSPIARLDDRSLTIRRRSAQMQLQAAKNAASDSSAIQSAELELEAAEANLRADQSNHRESRASVSLSQLRRSELEVRRSRAELAKAKKQSEESKLNVDLRDADLEMIDDQINSLTIESPIAGVALEVTRSAGEWIERGETIATVGRIDRLHVHALLRSDQLSPTVCRGLPVSVHWNDSTSNAARSLRGKVLSVDPQMLPGGRYRLHAEIVNQAQSDDGTQWLLNPGMEVRMKVYTSAATARHSSQLLR